MNTPILRCFLFALCLWASSAQAALFAIAGTDLAREAALAGREGKQLAVLFEQDGCSACQQLRRKVFSERHADKVFSQRYRTVSIDLASQGDLVTPDGKTVAIRAWAERLRILGTPALAFFDPQGQLLYRHIGPLANTGEFLLLGQYIAQGEYETRPFVSFLAAQHAKRSGTAAPTVCHTPAQSDSR